MEMLKKVIVFVLIAGLAGCGSSTSETSENDNDTKDDAVTETAKTEVETPETVTRENFRSFPETSASDFTGSIVDDGYEIQGCTSSDSVVVIPDEIDGMPVVSIGAYAMTNLSCEAIVLPDTVKRIGESAFAADYEMKYIYLGNSLESCGKTPFNNNHELLEIELPDGLTSVQSMIFSCKKLERLYVPASLVDIDIYLVFNCPNLTIYTPSGSVAEAYANENGIPVINE